MGFKSKYLEDATDTILKIDPSFNRDDLEKLIKKMMEERMTNPTVIMDNNVTRETIETNLVDLCSWIDKEKPVVSGNATFYCQPERLQSPTSNMLKSLKKLRKNIKKDMFQYKPTDDEYAQLDLAQLNTKVIMNAEYGASGTPTAAFYTKYSPAATTMMAQSVITIMAAFFEGYIGDRQRLFHINECMDWLNTVCKKEEKIPSWVIIPDKDEVKMRIKKHFFMYDVTDDVVIDKYIDHCTNEELIYIFYANNMKEFIGRHKKVRNITSDILSKLPLLEVCEKWEDVPENYKVNFEKFDPSDRLDKYNAWVSEEMFLNPYKVPAVIKDEIKDLVSWVSQMCYVDYLTPDSIVKLNNHKRNTVLLVDTDSNVLNVNMFVQFIVDEILPGETFGRQMIYNEMICINMLAAVLDKGIETILNTYGVKHFANEEARKELAMKNEFTFRRFLLIRNKKKRYASSIVLREGNMIIPYKTEIKGLDFIKAGVTDDVTARFTKILKDHILFSEDLQLHEMMKDLKGFEQAIYKDLKSGGTAYLKPQSYKSAGAYKNPWGVQCYKAVEIWNTLYPDDKIYSLGKVKLVKLVIGDPKDLDKIKDKYPEDYRRVTEKIFNSSDANLVKAGLKVIAIPATMKKTPEWIRELIDYQTIISDIVSSFRSILDTFQIEEVSVKTGSNRVNTTTALISI